MKSQPQTGGGRSPFGTFVLLAVTFAAGYVLGSRSSETEEWQEVESEPTEITIDGDEEEEEETEE